MGSWHLICLAEGCDRSRKSQGNFEFLVEVRELTLRVAASFGDNCVLGSSLLGSVVGFLCSIGENTFSVDLAEHLFQLASN